jgi:predicted kinase
MLTCLACGVGDVSSLPTHGRMLRCRRCGEERPFARPPLLVVTGTSGAGKSTICARLAGRIPGALLLDADVFAGEMVSVTPPDQDYPAFWRSMARLAHELSQNGVAVVFFSVMLPHQLLSNTDVLDYFESVEFLCLRCDAGALRDRFARRRGDDASGIEAAVDRWGRFDDELADAARSNDGIEAVDATRPIHDVESDVREWILTRLGGRAGIGVTTPGTPR